jgi:hypothetical protein
MCSSRHIQDAHLHPFRHLFLGVCQHHAHRKGSPLAVTPLSMASAYVPSFLLIPFPFPSVSLRSHSPLLPLPVHPSSGTHWLVSQVLSPNRPLRLLKFYRLISITVTTPTNCQALFVFIQWAGNTTIGASTSLLLIRTVAVWNRSRYIIAPMLVLAAGQWGLLYYSQLNISIRSIHPLIINRHTHLCAFCLICLSPLSHRHRHRHRTPDSDISPQVSPRYVSTSLVEIEAWPSHLH